MDISEIQQTITSKVPVAKFLDLQVELAEPGHMRLRLPFSRNVQNHLEIVYAGAIFALAEITGGMALLSVFDTSQYTILIERLCVDFQRPSRRDLWCELMLAPEWITQVQAQAESDGKAKITIPIEIHDERQRVIARIEGAYYLRRVKTSNQS